MDSAGAGCLLCFVCPSAGSGWRGLAAELCGQIFVENVTLQFSTVLYGSIFDENMTLQFGTELYGLKTAPGFTQGAVVFRNKYYIVIYYFPKYIVLSSLQMAQFLSA